MDFDNNRLEKIPISMRRERQTVNIFVPNHQFSVYGAFSFYARFYQASMWWGENAEQALLFPYFKFKRLFLYYDDRWSDCQASFIFSASVKFTC